MRVKFIKEIKFNNFKRYKSFIYSARKNRNIFIGDNEAGKSTILQAIDIVLRGSRAKVESLGLETLFNIDVINQFLSSDKNLAELPELTIEIFLNDHGNINLEGLNHSGDKVCHGMKLNCKPLIDDYGIEIMSALAVDNALFPFEYYSIKFETFAGQSYTQNRRFLNHILIDSSLIGTDFATRQYTKSLENLHSKLLIRKLVIIFLICKRILALTLNIT
jgi:putative ATP-dependent endonuclease of OLD family